MVMGHIEAMLSESPAAVSLVPAGGGRHFFWLSADF
jgi:hypothetical protein